MSAVKTGRKQDLQGLFLMDKLRKKLTGIKGHSDDMLVLSLTDKNVKPCMNKPMDYIRKYLQQSPMYGYLSVFF